MVRVHLSPDLHCEGGRKWCFLKRLELLTLLYSLDRMCKMKDFEGIAEVVEKLIKEAERKNTDEKD